MVSRDRENSFLAVVPHRQMFQAYIVACIPSGRKYVGITGGSVERRWRWHVTDSRRRTGSALWAAIRKYGESAFVVDAVACSMTLPGILDTERTLIMQHGTFAPKGYNLTLGGEGAFGVKHSAESVERSAAKHRGRPCHPNTREASATFHKGRKRSPEHRERIAAAKRGQPRNEATKAKLRAYWAERRSLGEFKTVTPYAHARKAASAHIAKIPFELARYIAAAWKPLESERHLA